MSHVAHGPRPWACSTLSGTPVPGTMVLGQCPPDGHCLVRGLESQLLDSEAGGRTGACPVQSPAAVFPLAPPGG